MNRFRVAGVALLVSSVAAFAAAQNADPNTAGPTRNDYRLRVIEPLEGAKITGNKFQLVVDTEIPAERDSRRDVNSMPRPLIDVFVDGVYRMTMRDGNNAIEVDNLAPGPHAVVLLAKNLSGEVIDRKEVHVIAAASRVSQPIAERPASALPPPQEPAPEVPVTAPEAPAAAPMSGEELPATASSDPLLLAAGLVLLLGGFVIRRLF